MSGRMCRTLVFFTVCVCVCVCGSSAAQSAGQKGKTAANWSASRASSTSSCISCVRFFTQNEIIWKCLSAQHPDPPSPTPHDTPHPPAKGSSIIREQTIKQNGFLFRFYIYIQFVVFAFGFLFRDVSEICLTIKGMSWSARSGVERWVGGRQLMMRCLIKWKFMAYAAKRKLFGHLMCCCWPACRKVFQQNYNNEALRVCLSVCVCACVQQNTQSCFVNKIQCCCCCLLMPVFKKSFLLLLLPVVRCLAIIWVVLQQRQTQTQIPAHTLAHTHTAHMCI